MEFRRVLFRSALAGDVGEGGRERDALRAVAGGAQFGLGLAGGGVAGDRACAAQVDVIRGGRRVLLRRLCGGRGGFFGRRFLRLREGKRAHGAGGNDWEQARRAFPRGTSDRKSVGEGKGGAGGVDLGV